MSKIHRLLSAGVICTIIALSLATPAHAFDGRGGDRVIIQADEVINDDLYVGAKELVLEGTVNGDVIAGAQTMSISGTVNGNLIAAAQSVIVSGTVTGDILAAGSTLFIGEKAQIGGDIVAAGYSLELRPGSAVGRDVVVASGQMLLGGNVTRNVLAATAAMEIAGTVGGNVKAQVGEANRANAGPPPSMFMPQSTVPVPLVAQGLTIDPGAQIRGNLQYAQNNDLSFPAGVVTGKVTRLAQPVEENRPPAEVSAGAKVGAWALNLVRTLITLILIGLFLFWVSPTIVPSMMQKLRAKPGPSLGWGVVAFAGFFFLLLLILFSIILGAVVFGVLTLGGLSGTIVSLGVVALLALIVGFVLATSFVAKIVFGAALGKWILQRTNPKLAENRYWPMIIGVIITIGVVALLSFPLIPGFLGGLVNFVVILAGLGAIWLWGRELLGRKPAAAA